MSLTNIIRQLLKDRPDGLTPQEIRDQIKQQNPEYYGTDSHLKNVERGHYKDIDHALLAQIYVVRRTANDIYADTSVKPMKLSLMAADLAESEREVEVLATEDLSRLEEGIGTLYVLGTNLYSKEGEEIIKIGITTGSVRQRINQLYNTSVPYRFRSIREYETSNYAELEQSMHKILDPFRINRSREYFTEGSLPFIEQLIEMHENILRKAGDEKSST